MLDYKTECKLAMTDLSKDKKVIFIGQTVEYDGSPMFKSLSDVPKEQKFELPIIEDCQMGMSIGLALEGYIPVSIFPRIDFLICATNQLVNHLDKVEQMSKGQFKPGVIIRTQIGNNKPLDPGIQHKGDYTKGLKNMLKNVWVVKIKQAEDVDYIYKHALKLAKMGKSSLIIETPHGGWKK